MIKRPTWILVIVLALLAGLVYYMQSVPDNFIKKALDSAKSPTPSMVQDSLLPIADGLITSIEMTSSDGHGLLLKKEANGWMFSLDSQTPILADQTAAEQASSQAQGMRLTTSAITPTSTDLSGFGLDKPNYIYKVTTNSGKILTFKIGHATVLNDGYYLQKEDGTIAVVEKFSMDTLLNLFTQPPLVLTATPTAAPVTETPTVTITPTQALTPTGTPTPGG